MEWQTQTDHVCQQKITRSHKNYSITELDLCGLAINIVSFSHLLMRVDFNAIIDHLSLTHRIKSKGEPAIVRIEELLELISSYSFNLYHIKGKDMVLSDFLSRQNNDDSNPHEIIPISFNMHKVLHENCYNIENYLVQTRSQARSSGIKLLEVHGVGKNLDPNRKPEKQHANPIKCYVRQCSLVLIFVLYFFKCLGFYMCCISLYVALSLHNCSSSGSLVFAHLGGIK